MLSCAAFLMAVSMAAAPEEELATMPADLRRQIDERMIGECTYEATWGDKKITGEEMTRWAGGKTGVVIQGHSTLGGKKSNYVVLMGWDAAENAFVSHGFNSEGETWTSRWTKFSGDKWEGKGEGIYQGKRWESPATLEFEKDSTRYEDVTDGKPWVAIYTRKAKAKQ